MTEEFTVIHTYTRRQAIADGVLVDATATAAEAGFGVPVALTAAAWGRCVAVRPELADQDEAGRLWDVLSILRFAVRISDCPGAVLPFRLYVQTEANAAPELIELKAVCGPDDDGTPCVTVMLPDED